MKTMLVPKLSSGLIEIKRRLCTKLPIIKKSFEEHNPLIAYCQTLSTPLHPALRDLQAETLKLGNSIMMGAPEVLSLNMFFIKALQAKKVLDIGVYTGSSSLAAALAVEDDGRVYSLEKSRKYTDLANKYWSEAGVLNKIELCIGPALETMDKMLQTGHRETFDFAFIDADKGNYVNYYNGCLELLRRGGIVTLDNTLFKGKVLNPDSTNKTVNSIKLANEFIRNDDKVDVLVLSIGDGYTIAIKK